ncbi:MAG TPA: dihydrodipicolinate synthase family protein [Acidimicrobiales bacterium]|nr:dihydrodipicolinate synthase family protein [Acidimicrobiales bacterium]
MSAPVFEGVGVALVTLFADHGGLDAAATAEHAERLVDLGVRAVVVAGSTGEAATLDRDERVHLMRAVREQVEVPVVAGTGAPSSRQAVAFTRDACDEGADAVLALSPPGIAHVHPYYEAVAEAAGDVPLLAYHFPGFSPPGIPLEVLPSLPVAGCKDSSGDPGRLLDTLDVFDRPLYTGSSALLALAGPAGCAGAILSLANVDPERCVAAFAGDVDAQRQLAAVRRAEGDDFPAGTKRLTAARFGTSPVMRVG